MAATMTFFGIGKRVPSPFRGIASCQPALRVALQKPRDGFEKQTDRRKEKRWPGTLL
jgi:hypothetical protein